MTTHTNLNVDYVFKTLFDIIMNILTTSTQIILNVKNALRLKKIL